jgi:acetolactate synthase-1/2/3 large subunit
MPKRRNSPDVARRSFLKSAGLVGAAALTPVSAKAQIAAPRPDLKAAVPGPKQIAADTMRPSTDPATQTSNGGDFMVDVLKTFDFDYLAMTCASSFRGIHESLVDPAELAPAVAAVKSGQPALVDVVSEPR